MTTLNIQAAQNENDEACRLRRVCMAKEEILSGFDNALHELEVSIVKES